MKRRSSEYDRKSVRFILFKNAGKARIEYVKKEYK